MVTCALDCVCYLSSYNFKIVQQMSTGVIIANFIKIQIYQRYYFVVGACK